MNITLLCDNKDSWIIPYISELEYAIKKLDHSVEFINNFRDIKKGDIIFFLGCEKIIPSDYLRLNNKNIVVHESELPKGKGWSPLTWTILEGNNKVTVTLIEAIAKVDSGQIYLQEHIQLDGTELLIEIKHLQGEKTKELILKFIKQYPSIQGQKQEGTESFYPKRTPKDSELDINKAIDEQFNLLRVVDNDRYPAFFYRDGQKYILKIYKDESAKL